MKGLLCQCVFMATLMGSVMHPVRIHRFRKILPVDNHVYTMHTAVGARSGCEAAGVIRINTFHIPVQG
jgi:hypothetical protein